MVLSESQKLTILREEAKGIKSIRQIAKLVKCSHPTVLNVISKYKNHGTISRLPGGGRKRITDDRTDREMKYIVSKSSKVNTNHIKAQLDSINIKISKSTIRRRLRERGFNGRIRRRVPMISKVNRRKRLAYAKEQLNQPYRFWENVMFIDEKKFNLISKSSSQYVWRRKNEPYKDGYTAAYARSQSIMVWGCFGANGVGRLVEIETTMNGIAYRDIIKKHIRPSAKKVGLKRGWHMLQDNDPKHKSKIVQSELVKMRIKQINHPPQSPDINPIENLWKYVDDRISYDDRNSIKDFRVALFRAWENIPIDICRKYATSMPKRFKEVCDNKGRATHY